MKRAEGIVTLVVCNPNKKDKEKESEKEGSKKEKKGETLHIFRRINENIIGNYLYKSFIKRTRKAKGTRGTSS